MNTINIFHSTERLTNIESKVNWHIIGSSCDRVQFDNVITELQSLKAEDACYKSKRENQNKTAESTRDKNITEQV